MVIVKEVSSSSFADSCNEKAMELMIAQLSVCHLITIQGSTFNIWSIYIYDYFAGRHMLKYKIIRNVSKIDVK